tara:strand:+ start:4689 stop:5384 length:696 start_codon:yes stop_codon:yes gene_type:complete
MIETIIDILPYISIAGYTMGKGNQFWTPGAFESNFSPFEDKGTDITVRNSYSGNQNDIDTSNIDFGDKNQVMNIQKALNAAGAVDSEGNPLAVDGMFGNNTEFAYRNYINQKRTSQGKDAYGYGSEAPMNVNQENMNIPSFLPQNDGNPVNNNYVYPEDSYSLDNPEDIIGESVYDGPFDFAANENNMVSDANISPAEVRARDRALDGKYVFNRNYRQKYQPGRRLFDFLK